MKFIPGKKTWLQILFWGVLWVALPILLVSNWEYSERFLIRSLIVFFGIVVVVWLNVELLLPKLFFQKKQWIYLLAGLGAVALLVLLEHWDFSPWSEYFERKLRRPPDRHRPVPSPWQFMRYIGSSLPYLTAFISSSFFEIASFANRKEKEASESRSEKLEAEMKFLKSQFNPHFLFNALNNIYSLSVIKSDRTPDNLLKLSGMLRYMLYDCKADRVPLKKEIEYLHHFIDLHLLKDSRGLNVKVHLDESRPDLQIAPMLFLPFVENAFKHSRIEDLENGWIDIRLSTAEQSVTFEVSNSLPAAKFTKDKEGGIGLENVRRQLELLYPDRHELRIGKKEGRFEVFLKIEI